MFDFWTDAPSCSPNQPRVYGVAKQEQAQIKCSVDANPADVEFKWTFNNSAESIDVASNHVTRSGKCFSKFNLFSFAFDEMILTNQKLLMNRDFMIFDCIQSKLMPFVRKVRAYKVKIGFQFRWFRTKMKTLFVKCWWLCMQW